MQHIILSGKDRALATFYYRAYLAPFTINHNYRNGSLVSYTTLNEGMPQLIALAEKLDLSYEIVAVERPYERLKKYVEKTYSPGETFTARDVMIATRLTQIQAGRALLHLTRRGYIQAHGKTKGRYYSRTAQEEKPNHAADN